MVRRHSIRLRGLTFHISVSFMVTLLGSLKSQLLLVYVTSINITPIRRLTIDNHALLMVSAFNIP